MTYCRQGKLLIAVLLALVAGCSTTNSVYEEKLKKDEYLKRNYPNIKPQENEIPALKTEFFDEITAGKVVVGMSLVETMAATKMVPYGPNHYGTVYWCDKRVVAGCNERCGQCASVLLTEQRAHLLQGKGNKLFVVKSLPRQRHDTVAALTDKPLEVVTGVFLNQIVTGMSVDDFNRIRPTPHSKTEFYCKNQRVFQSCLRICGDCTVKIISPRNNKYHVQTVRFRGNSDYATVVDINESVQTSMQ